MSSKSANFWKSIIQWDDTAIVPLLTNEAMMIMSAIEDGTLITSKDIRLVPNYEDKGYILYVDIVDLSLIVDVLKVDADFPDDDTDDELPKDENEAKVENLTEDIEKKLAIVEDDDTKEASAVEESACAVIDDQSINTQMNPVIIPVGAIDENANKKAELEMEKPNDSEDEDGAWGGFDETAFKNELINKFIKRMLTPEPDDKAKDGASDDVDSVD